MSDCFRLMKIQMLQNEESEAHDMNEEILSYNADIFEN